MMFWWRERRIRRLLGKVFEYIRLSQVAGNPDERHYWRMQQARAEQKIQRLNWRQAGYRVSRSGRGSFGYIDEWRP